ncbi:MAG: alanine--tRNA ligase [Balneolaceae bacterium]
MKGKGSDQIRQDFFDFFKQKQHIVVESAPVVPREDPSLLFTNAGMNQFKPIFLGNEAGYSSGGKLWTRAVNTQRCIRVSGKHNDLEEVGHDTYHHTMFEMLGNWSFGDYFKKEAIEWAWELLVDRWGLEPGRLYVTVFEGSAKEGLPVDEESLKLWESETDISPKHILKFGKKDNFWEMGETGPCGPSSEIHVDLRPDSERRKLDGATLVNRDDPRVMEIWNLVFIQFNRKKEGTLEKLPAQHVDTGMGFERVCAILQEKQSNYDTDVFQPLLNKISSLAGREYGEEKETDIAMRVIADHIRSVSFAVADGASPSNEGRGYVIRRILRRAIRYGWDKLNFKDPFLYKLVPVLAGQFKDIFPVLQEQSDYVVNVIKAEEQSFLKTLGQGIDLFNEMIREQDVLSGRDAFKLHDTYGFPIDLTELMAHEQGIEVDTETFTRLMQEQKARGRASGKFTAGDSSSRKWTVTGESEGFQFVGYDEYETETHIRAVAEENGRGIVLLDRSPFYAESGGQLADTGFLVSGDERLRVLDVQKSGEGHLHVTDRLPVNVRSGWLAQIDAGRRLEIRKHHTATHLMHAALREVLGDHVVQKGSLVAEERLRFDFSHFEAVTQDQLDEIELIVNRKIQANIPREEERELTIEEARRRGAMMLFGEKYGDRVRMITFDPDFSMELCGGTHVDATGEIGYFRFLNETSVAAGIRRVEAVAGRSADRHLRNEKHLLQKIHRVTETGEDPAGEIEQLLSENRSLKKELERLHQKQAAGLLDDLLMSSELIGDLSFTAGEVAGADMDTLKQMGYDALEKRKKSAVTLLGSRDTESGKVYLMAAVTPDLFEKGVQAGALVSELGKVVGGGGGGQANIATAGGRFPEKMEEAFVKGKSLIKEKLQG